MKMKVVLVALAAIALCQAQESENTLDTVLGLVKDCEGDFSLCIKEKVLKIVDNVRAAKSLTIVNGVTLKSDPEKRTPKNADPLPTDPELRDAELNSRIIDGVINVAETHSLEVNIGDKDGAEGIKRSLEEGRKKKNKGGGMGGIIALLMLKLGLKKLLLIKLLALKALMVGKIGLVLAVILFIHHILNQGHTKTTYEVVPHAHHSHDIHHDHHDHHEIAHHGHDIGHGHHEIAHGHHDIGHGHHEIHHPHIEHSFSGHGGDHFGGHSDGHFSSYGGGGVGGGDWAKSIDDAQNLAYSGYSGHSRK